MRGFSLIIGFVLAGLAFLSSLAAAATPEKKDISIAVSGPPAQLYFLPVVLAKELGYFEQEGLNVQLQHFNAGSKALEAVLGGSADLVAGAYEHTIRLQTKGQHLQSIVLFGRYPENVLGIAKSQAVNYKGPADLKGKVIGITGPGSATQTFLNLILESAGLKPSDVSTVTVGAGAVAVAAMRRQSELFAISNLDLAITELASAGDIAIAIDSRTAEGTHQVYGGDYASGSVYGPASFSANNPNSAQAVANAMVRTLKWLSSAKPDDIIAKLPPDFYKQNLAVYREALERNLPSFTREGLMSAEAAGNVLKAMQKFDPDVAKAKIDLPATYENKFVEAALKMSR